MREIKYRALDAATKKWVYGYYVVLDSGYELVDCIWQLGAKRATPIDPSTIGQYIGLTDKKRGREVYGGDIVEITHLEDESKTIGQVEWGLDSHRYGNYPAFTIPEFDSDLNSFAEIFDSGDYDIEVIGNIYENPDLLKENEK